MDVTVLSFLTLVYRSMKVLTGEWVRLIRSMIIAILLVSSDMKPGDIIFFGRY